MMIVLTKIFYCKDTENELKSYHIKTNWANFVWMQDSWMLFNEIGQYFMTKDTAQMQWLVVSTLCQETKIHLNQKVGIRGNTKIGPVLEVTTCCLQGKYGVEIKIEVSELRQFSLMGQNFSWLNQVGHEFEQQRAGNLKRAVRRVCVKIQCGWLCKPNKGQSKTTKTRICQLIHKNYIHWRKKLDWCWTRWIFNLRFWSVEEINFIFFVMEVYLEKMMVRLNSGESKTIFRNISCIVIIGLTKTGREASQEEEETRKDTSIVLIHQEQSCTSELFKSIQDAISLILLYRTMLLIPNNFFQYIYHVGYAINLHSNINSGLIPGCQNLSNRQTVFFVLVDPMDKNHKDSETIDLGAPRHAQYNA